MRHTWQPSLLGLDTILATQESINLTYYFYDANKNVTQKNVATTNLHESYNCTPFGDITDGRFVHIVFSSELNENFLGLVYFNYRYLFPKLGRWISQDQLFEKGGLNIYSYCNNSPIVWYDLLGLESRKKWESKEGKEEAICIALKKSGNDLKRFIELYDPTFKGEDMWLLRNIEIETPIYGEIDVDWLLTILAANKGHAGILFKNTNPIYIYITGKLFWIIKDALTDKNVNLDFSRFGQDNELQAIMASLDLLKGKIDLISLFSIDCSKYCLE